MEERTYDCSDYSSERCPRGVVTPFTTTEHREIDLIFVGCWGTYCSDETQIFGKQGGRESVTYGSKTVARALEEATTDHSVDAVVLAGDNVYTMPCDMFREMHDPNLDDDQLFVEYKRNFPHARAMQFQMQHGFQDCFANVQASELMGEIYDTAEQAGFSPHEASILLPRLLFLMFGDDTGLWPRAAFQEFIETRTQKDGSDVGAELAMLFQILNTNRV